MKLKHIALSMAIVMAVALTGCSAGRENSSMAPVDPTNSMTSDYDSRASANNDYGAGAGSDAGLNNGTYPSSTVGDNNVGGNYDPNNVSGAPSNGDNVIDDIGDAAGDLARGAGNAIGNAANDVGRAMR